MLHLQFQELLVILIVVFFVFGSRNLPDLGKRLGRAALDSRGQWSDLRGALFMAKGVDPTVGRDVGDMLPDEEARRSRFRFLLLLSILIGNTLYFLSWPWLPAAARIGEGSSALPVLVDLLFCFFVFCGWHIPQVLGGRTNHDHKH
jgi:hypothetical protein